MLFGEMTTVYSENHAQPMNTSRGKMQLLIIKPGGSYHWAYKDNKGIIIYSRKTCSIAVSSSRIHY
jgi:hypothetical protein